MNGNAKVFHTAHIRVRGRRRDASVTMREEAGPKARETGALSTVRV